MAKLKGTTQVYVINLSQAYSSNEIFSKDFITRNYPNQMQLLDEIYTSMPVIGHAGAAAYTQICFRLAWRQTVHVKHKYIKEKYFPSWKIPLQILPTNFGRSFQ